MYFEIAAPPLFVGALHETTTCQLDITVEGVPG